MTLSGVRLQEIGERAGTDKALFHKYLDFYEEHLPDRDFNGRLLEIGIMDGLSLKMWHEYYPDAEIIGIDIFDKSRLRIDGASLLQVNGTDIEALRELGNFDIIVDDGSHNTLDQQISFYWLYCNQLNDGGFYIIEDLHTSLMPGYKNSKYTTLEMLDRLDIEISHYRRNKDENDSMTSVIKAGQPLVQV